MHKRGESSDLKGSAVVDAYGNEPERCFTVGLIGSGDIAFSAHLPVLVAMRSAQVAWVTDIDDQKSKFLARAYGVPCATFPADPRALPDADVMLMTAPFGVREPYYEALQKRDCAIYVEKPFALTEEEHRRTCARFPSYALTSGLMMRCWGATQMMRQIVASKLFGPLRTARFGFGRPGLVTGGRYYFDKNRGGGGMIAELGIHGVDTLLFVSQAVTASVDDVKLVRDNGCDLHTEARLTLRTESHEAIACRITITALHEVSEGVEFQFDDAVVSYLLPGQGYALHGNQIDLDVCVRPVRAGRSYTLHPAHSPMTPGTKFQMFYDYWRRFLQGIHNREQNLTTAESALLTTQVIQKISEVRTL